MKIKKTSTKQGLMCLALGHNAMTPVRLQRHNAMTPVPLEPASPQSTVNHTTTELQRSQLHLHL